MNKKTEACVPRLRFPEFREAGEWEKRELSTIADRLTTKVGSLPLIPISITAGSGIVSQEDKFGRQIAGAQYKNYLILRRGEFAYNKGNSKKYPQGCIYQLKEFDVVAAPNAFICFKLKEQYVQDYLQPLFEDNRHGNQLIKYITSGARSDGLLNIDPNNFFKIKLPFPPTLPEQQKIADCLASLDTLLTAHSAKLDALKQYKKGLLQQLFPAEGERVPRLRFAEFAKAGEWEEKKLGDFANICMCKRIFAEETNPIGDVPFFKIGTLGSKPDCYISRQLFNEYKQKFSFPRKGELLLTCSGTVGKCIIYQGEDAYYQDSNIVWISNNEHVLLNSFLFFLLNRINWNHLNTSTITRIYGDDLRRFSFIVPPTLPEQQKIADCLSSLDALIAAQGEKIAALKEHKKGLLQQLFPQGEGAGAFPNSPPAKGEYPEGGRGYL